MSSKSFSLYIGAEEIPCSDCVIAIAPKKNFELESIRLLLMIRVSVALGADAMFEISGGGANYISLLRLKNLYIPKHGIFDDIKIIKKYKKLLLNNDVSKALDYEKKIARDINKVFGNSTGLLHK